MTKHTRHGMTAVDWLLCALLAAGAMTLTWYALRARGADAKTATVSYTVRIAGADATLFDASPTISPGDAIFSENGTLPLGTVTELHTRPHRRTVVRDGEIQLADVPQRIDIDVTVSATGSYTAGLGWRISEIRIAAGEMGSFHIGAYYATQAEIIGVTVREASGNAGK
ncbi:MAG: DUF4330 family protein [Clostridia bacterium]|nr:DUF4330 family protein [Clostridia bacterium]